MVAHDGLDRIAEDVECIDPTDRDCYLASPKLSFLTSGGGFKITFEEYETPSEYEYAVVTLPDSLLKIKLTAKMKELLKTRYMIDEDKYVGRRVLLVDILDALKIKVEDIWQCECDLLYYDPKVKNYFNNRWSRK